MADDTPAGQFPLTEWTLVLTAGRDSSLSAAALEKLCRSYWQPLYAYARRRGQTPEASEDAVQGFLETILARGSLSNVEREGGRFRSWLLGGFVHHLANLHRHERTARRGGGVLPVSIEEAEAALPADSSLTPDEAYDRRWAELVLATAVERLREQHERARKVALWAALAPAVTARAATSYASLGAVLGISEQAVGLHVYRLRQRLKKLVRAEIARTVLTEADLEVELNYLLGLFRRR